MCECVLNVNGKMFIILYLSSTWTGIIPHCVFFNRIVSRLLLSVTATRGAPLSDTDADQRALGRPGARREICARKIPHAHCLEVSVFTYVDKNTGFLKK